MKYPKLLKIIVALAGMALGVLLAQLALAAVDQIGQIDPQDEYNYYKTNIAKLLDWVPANNICKGYFAEPPQLGTNPQDLPISKLPSQISAAGPTLFSRNGPSVLFDDVIYTQPGRMATADKAVIYRNASNGRLELIHLSGNVHLREPGDLIVGPYGDLNLGNGTASFGPAAYHLTESPAQYHRIKSTYNGWGQAEKVERHPNGVIDLYHASYSTCAPEEHPPWQISAQHVSLDHDKAIGHAYHTVLRVKGVPIFYMPYYTFPLNSDRKSGMLMPIIDYSANNGLGARIPIYWNMAPNYDMTFSPRIMSNRGVQFNDLFRYLNHFSYNQFYASFIPYDAGFAKFRRQTLNNPPDINPVTVQPYLDQLQEDSASRAYLSTANDFHFSPDWQAHIIGNYVTDSYYFKNFGAVYGEVDNNQLLNQADMSYRSNHWDLYGMVQGFQTLHQIGNASGDVQSQYLRMPELDINANYPNLWHGLVAQLSGQSVDFWYQSDFNPVTDRKPIGERLHLMPSISRPFTWVSGYLTPQIALDDTNYYAQNSVQNSENGDTRPQVHASRNLPILDIDSGLYLQRNWDFGLDGFIQTLEPRLFYLYVPFQNQDQYPLFDTQLLNFSYDQLFSLNRFSSVDRLENANQVSLGVTSRFLDAASGDQNLQTDLGVIYYITPPKVCLDPLNCENSTFNKLPPDSTWSPIVGDIKYNFLTHWATTAQYAWNPEIGKTDNGKLQFSYHYDPVHIWNFGYQYITATGNPEDRFGLSNNTNYIYTGIAWPITEKLSALGYVYYNFSKERFDSSYTGLQYDTCCWAIRFIAQRNWISNQQNVNSDTVENNFDTSFAIQIDLKSIGNIGTGTEKSLINRTLGGFANPFED